MEILKIATAGSVDDGKSTLIGRLLYETDSLKSDQLEHFKAKSESRGFDYLDLSLATDGLLTEREQGITIDVSHIFFSTPIRRFIIADSPGHVEYTRNMVTGASTAQASILLLDARKGMVEQTRRHLYINRLLGIQHLVFAINKMDLVDFDQGRFEEIKQQVETWLQNASMQIKTIDFVPISALLGDNVTSASKQMNWYNSSTLLEILEKLPTISSLQDDNLLQVQHVLRPKTEQHHDYRGFAGKVNSGSFQVGDKILVYPSGRSSQIKSIEKYGIAVSKAQEGESTTILLEDEIDISRGNSIVSAENDLQISKQLRAEVCWMQDANLIPGAKYWLQLGVQKVQIKIKSINHLLQLENLKTEPTNTLGLNDIGEIEFVTAQEIVHQPFLKNKGLGAFILIDALTYNTAGVGFIR
ncbi:MAG: sulfate adenylyltransferase subunit 1 [Flavobacteriaceae bacterium]